MSAVTLRTTKLSEIERYLLTAAILWFSPAAIKNLHLTMAIRAKDRERKVLNLDVANGINRIGCRQEIKNCEIGGGTGSRLDKILRNHFFSTILFLIVS